MERDATAQQLSDEIVRAREELVAKLEEAPERWWSAYELKDQARNGFSAGATNMALGRLLDSDAFEVRGDRIRLRR